MAKRKEPEPETEADTFGSLAYRMHEMQHTFPPEAKRMAKAVLVYAERHPEMEDLPTDDPRVQRLVGPFSSLYAPWIREKRARCGAGEEAFREAVKDLVEALTERVEQGDRLGRERAVKSAIADFELAVEGAYENVDVLDPNDWPFSY